VRSLAGHQLATPILKLVPVDVIAIETTNSDIQTRGEIGACEFSQEARRVAVSIHNIKHVAGPIGSAEPIENKGGSSVEKHVGIKHKLPTATSHVNVSDLAQMRIGHSSSPKLWKAGCR
jgi:hypothetical protein